MTVEILKSSANISFLWNRVGEAASRAIKTREQKKKGGLIPLLSYIDGRAGMGEMMYIFDTPPIINLIRSFERAAFRLLKPRERNAVLLRLSFAHREGHIKGLGMALGEKGSIIVDKLMSHGERNNLDGQTLAQQGAALLEAAGDNQDLRKQVRIVLRINPVWQQRVIVSGTSQGLELHGLLPEDQLVLPGAVNFNLLHPPITKIDKVLNPILDWWTSVTAQTTYQRAIAFTKLP